MTKRAIIADYIHYRRDKRHPRMEFIFEVNGVTNIKEALRVLGEPPEYQQTQKRVGIALVQEAENPEIPNQGYPESWEEEV